jgi:hypothetical protein
MSHHTHVEDDVDDAAVSVGAEVGVGVGVGVGVAVAVDVGVCVAVRVTVDVCVAVWVTAEVFVAVGVEVFVAVRVGVGVRDSVGVDVSAGVRDVESVGRADSDAEASGVEGRVAVREAVGSATLGRSEGRSPPPQAVTASPSIAASSATLRTPAAWRAHPRTWSTAQDDLAPT